MKILSLEIGRKNKFNIALFLLMLVLLVVGCVFVYSASFYSAGITYGDKLFFLKKQFFGVAVGFVGYFFFAFFDDILMHSHIISAFYAMHTYIPCHHSIDKHIFANICLEKVLTNICLGSII